MNVTEKQKSILENYMRRNPDFARGRLRYNTGNKNILDNMWYAVSNSLNAVANGPQKQPKEWQKTWRDWKANVLKKCAKNKSYAGGTGGGPPKILPLSELEETLLSVIGPESAGLDNVPEGGSFNRKVPPENLPHEDVIPDGGLFERFNRKDYPKRSAPQFVEKGQNHFNKNKKVCTSSLSTYNEIFKTQTNSPSTSAIGFNRENEFSELHLSEPEMESTNTVDDDYLEFDLQDSAVVLQRRSTELLPSEQANRTNYKCAESRKDTQNGATSNSNRRNANQSNASTAVDLMREKNDLLKQQMAANEKFQNSIIEIENAKLEILKKQNTRRGEMFDYLESILPKITDWMTHIDDNVTSLKEDVEKIAPSYLE